MQSHCPCARTSMFSNFLPSYSCGKKMQSDLAAEWNYQKGKVPSSFIEVGVQVKEKEKIQFSDYKKGCSAEELIVRHQRQQS